MVVTKINEGMFFMLIETHALTKKYGKRLALADLT